MVEFWEYLCYFVKIMVSKTLVMLAVNQEVKLRFYCSLVRGGAQHLLSGQPGLSVLADFYCQVVLTQSVFSYSFPQFFIRHCGQVICHGVLSVSFSLSLSLL